MVLSLSSLLASASVSSLLLLGGGATTAAAAADEGTPITCGSSIKLKHKESVSAQLGLSPLRMRMGSHHTMSLSCIPFNSLAFTYIINLVFVSCRSLTTCTPTP